MDEKQAIEYDKMEKFIMTDLSELFEEMDQRIVNSDFSDEIKKRNAC